MYKSLGLRQLLSALRGMNTRRATGFVGTYPLVDADPLPSNTVIRDTDNLL